MEIEVILPPAPEDVIPDREADRLFFEMCWREYMGEFDDENNYFLTDDEYRELIFGA